jgi:hypothetical protein
MGLGLVIGFIAHLKVLTTINYNRFTDLHTKQITTAHTKPSLSSPCPRLPSQGPAPPACRPTASKLQMSPLMFSKLNTPQLNYPKSRIITHYIALGRTAWTTLLPAVLFLLCDVTAVMETHLSCHCLATCVCLQSRSLAGFTLLAFSKHATIL